MANTELSIDRMFALLANRRRRYVFYCLNGADAVVGLDDLVAQIVEWEREWDGETDEEPAQHRENVGITLHHNHLPLLADTPLIDYDARSRTVRCRNSSFEGWISDDHPECERLEALF